MSFHVNRSSLFTPDSKSVRRNTFGILLFLLMLSGRIANAEQPAQVDRASCPIPKNVIVTEYTIPTPNSEPFGITTRTDGTIWFAEGAGMNIGRITAEGKFTEYRLPVKHSDQHFLAAGPDGAVWFTDDFQNKIGQITSEGTITEYSIPSGKEDTDDNGVAFTTSYPRGLVIDANGTVWFTENSGNNIGRISADGKITEYPIPTLDSAPVGITLGLDGAVWFVEKGTNQIGQITSDGKITEYPIPTRESSVLRIATAADSMLWFTEFAGNKIGCTTPDEEFTEFALPTGASPVGITALGNTIWFTEFNGNKIGCITSEGQVTEYPISTPASMPFSITAGADGALWFTENANNKIGRLQISSEATQTTFSSQRFALPIHLSFSADWHITDNFSDLVTIQHIEKDWELGFNIVNNAQVVDPVNGKRIPFPKDFASWIQENPDFKPEPPTNVAIAGIHGQQIDVTPTPIIKKDFLFLSETGWNMFPGGEHWRFILLDEIHGKHLLIMLLVPAEQFEVAAKNAQELLNSLTLIG